MLSNEEMADLVNYAARYCALRDRAREVFLNPKAASSELCPDLRTKFELPTLICAGPAGSALSFDEAVDIACGLTPVVVADGSR